MKVNSAPSKQSLVWLMLGLSLGALPHFLYQPIWVAILFSALIAWRGLALFKGWPLPSKHFSKLKIIHLAVAGVATALLFFSYGSLIGRDAGVALLTVMLGLKIVEIRSARDYYVSCFLGYFLVVTNFFYSQSIPTAILMFIVVIIMTASLISLNDPKQSLNNKTLLKHSSKMLLQAVPLMLFLFVLFPRISGPLWGLPQDAHTAKSGMDNSMELGKISQLILSDDIAFRVKFADSVPPAAKRYWRGPVLWHSDGKKWTELSANQQQAAKPVITETDDAFDYAITIEPHNKHWLFALDMPTQAVINTQLSYDGQLRSTKPINQRQQYQLRSHAHYSFNAEDDRFLDAALALPQGQHLRSRELAQSWRQQNNEPQAIINKALSYFNQNAFYYTLTPPQLNGDVIDRFLFESRRGFCEHYAASFTVLMRAAGIPARVVTGYQGGELNPVDQFWVVRQRDAHAWVEVWLANQGWQRVDPTASVSQDRIDLGMANIMPAEFNNPLFVANNQRLTKLWQTMRDNWDALDNAWNQWVLAYGPEQQKQFLTQLGMSQPDWQKMALWLAISLISTVALISIFLFYQRKKIEPALKLYHSFCHRAAKLGVTRHASEGPLDYAQRLKQVFPQSTDDIEQITALFINLHYGDQSASITELQRAIKHLKLTSNKTNK